MKYAELENKTQEELRKSLEELRVKIGKCRFELANGALKDSSQIKKSRRDIAKILMAINKARVNK